MTNNEAENQSWDFLTTARSTATRVHSFRPSPHCNRVTVGERQLYVEGNKNFSEKLPLQRGRWDSECVGVLGEFRKCCLRTISLQEERILE